MRRFLPVVVLIVGCALAGPAQAVSPSSVALPNTPAPEAEPNGTPATATPFAASGRMRGLVVPNGDIDVYSFTATAGERVYAATGTIGSASGSLDTTLELLASDATTVLETDADDGTFGNQSSSIAGALIPADGTYYLSVRHPANTAQVRPYDLYLTTHSGASVAETEDNALATPQALPAGGHAGGALSAATDVDAYSFALNAGDTVFVSLDMDPERDTITWDGRLGLGTFGSGANSVLRITDANGTSPNSEAFFMTVKSSGTYVAEVSAAAATFGTYNLSVEVVPGVTSSCRVYDSSAPVGIPTGPGMVTSTITVPDDVVMGRVALELDVTHAFMGDLDISLQTPAGNEIVLLTDVGGATVGGPDTEMDVLLDTGAALAAPAFPRMENQMLRPEGIGGQLSWLEGERSGGTWTLVVRDDLAGDGGTLNGWRLVLCEADPPPSGTTSLYSTSFDADDGGFTHSGTADEWERGLPAFAPITTCAGGSGACWKTDLDNTYNASNSQDLLSPPIALGSHPNVQLSWAQRYQIESATFDHYFVEVREVGVPGSERRVFEWTGATMTQSVGNPSTTIQQSAGWGVVPVDISPFAGKTVEVRFHLDGDTTVQLAGAAVDDVQVLGFDGTPPDTSIDSGPSGTTSDATPTFTFSSTEVGSTFQCRVDSASFAACTSPHTTAQLANGDHTFEVRATDSNGNTDASPASRSFTVDTGGGNPPPVGDTTAPGFRLSGARRQKAGKSVLVVVTATTENMFATATGTVVVPGASKVFRLRAVRNRVIANGAKARMRLKVPKKAQRAIKRALRRRKKVSARITVSVRDAAGNRASAKRRIKLRR